MIPLEDFTDEDEDGDGDEDEDEDVLLKNRLLVCVISLWVQELLQKWFKSFRVQFFKTKGFPHYYIFRISIFYSNKKTLYVIFHLFRSGFPCFGAQSVSDREEVIIEISSCNHVAQGGLS